MLWGAERALRESISLGGEPYSQYRYNQEVAACRQALGELAFDVAFGKGSSMTMEETIELALEETSEN